MVAMKQSELCMAEVLGAYDRLVGKLLTVCYRKELVNVFLCCMGAVCYFSLYFYMCLYVFGKMIELVCKFISEKYHHHYYHTHHAYQGVGADVDFVGKEVADSL